MFFLDAFAEEEHSTLDINNSASDRELEGDTPPSNTHVAV